MKNKLISMTDFVFEQNSTEGKPLMVTNWAKEFELRFKKIVKYANFLKQPLELWMFVPCDEYGNVLDKSVHIIDGKLSSDFQKAQSKVLFDKITGYKICNNGGFYISYNENSMVFIYKKDTIEKLVGCDMQLKQLEL